ncbi:MAG TPA: RNA chaperone Hfq [Terracidiphilus sp.]|nr:RNA chaperone Hfq [Terracidiphilus sp.]
MSSLPSLSSHAIPPPVRNGTGPNPGRPPARARKTSPTPIPFRFPAHTLEDEAPRRDAELFYLQKQIQSQTPMVIVLEDGERIEGCIEWYDRNTLKVRGRSKTLIYKSAIKYMYKLGETGQ